GRRDLTGRECYTDGSGNRPSLACRFSNANKIAPLRGRGARHLVKQHDPGDSTSLFCLAWLSARHVISAKYGRAGDPFYFCHLTGHIEVHPITAVITIEAKYARTAVGCPDRVDARLHTRSLEDIADGAGI